jgi:hypothetical protein
VSRRVRIPELNALAVKLFRLHRAISRGRFKWPMMQPKTARSVHHAPALLAPLKLDHAVRPVTELERELIRSPQGAADARSVRGPDGLGALPRVYAPRPA